MKIRKGKMSDAKELLRILKETKELNGTEKEKAYTLKFVKGAITKPDRDLVLIAEENSKMAGFLMAELWKNKGYSFLVEIFVKPEFRKVGIASKLFEEYEKYCRKNNMTFINAMVLVSNKKMQKWCKKHKITKGDKVYFYEKELK